MKFQYNKSLKSFNSFGVDAVAQKFLHIQSIQDLQWAISRTDDSPFHIIGGGSNILFTDDLPGTVLYIDIKERTLVHQSEDWVEIALGAGENWHESVLWTVEHGWGGLENLSLIPGKVGAAPIQNIGAYGVELSNVFQRLEAMEVETGNKLVFEKRDCEFGYRDSIFKRSLKGKVIITRVYLKLSKNPQINISYGAISKILAAQGIAQPTIRNVSDAIIDIRRKKLPDPLVLGNAGSFFKNPVVEKEAFNRISDNFDSVPSYPVNDTYVKIPAAWLIEQCGWKGKKHKNTGTYSHHALVIVNHGGSNGNEIWECAQNIRQDVYNKFGINLETEVNIW